jgi:hypothetical protein
MAPCINNQQAREHITVTRSTNAHYPLSQKKLTLMSPINKQILQDQAF